MVSGSIPGGNLYFANELGEAGVLAELFYNLSEISGNVAANGTAYTDAKNANGLFDVTGSDLTINDLLIVGEDKTITTSTEQSLPFGTFWVINDPIIIEYSLSGIFKKRAIKNRIDETTFF